MASLVASDQATPFSSSFVFVISFMLTSRAIFSILFATSMLSAHAQNVGVPFCTQAQNSQGVTTALGGTYGPGAGSGLHLEATNGVPGELGFFLAGNEATPGIIVSNGSFCLAGTGTARFYRYSLSGGESNSLGQFDAAGVLQNLAGTSAHGTGFDIPSTIPDTLPIGIVSGDTWHFQLWHRDTPAAQGSSNFSNGLSVTFPVPAPPVPVAGMVPIPAGFYVRGSHAAGGSPYFTDLNSADRPMHGVTISQGFWMAEHEVTQGEYQALMGVNPSTFSGTNRPVETVSWHSARAYCAALTAQQVALGNVPAGYEYRLPTDAEWEYACRAGTSSEFVFGPDLFCAQGKFDFSHHSNTSCNSAATAMVGSYTPNAWGLYDMHGNVREWCLDTFNGYQNPEPIDPFHSVGGNGGLRVIRGGGWAFDSSRCRSAYRVGSLPGLLRSHTGFRVVLARVLVL